MSYVLIDRNTNQPTMIMEPLEYAAYRNAAPGTQALMQLSPQYALEFASAGLYASAGDSSRAMEHTVVGVTSRDHVRDVALGVAGAAVALVSVARPATMVVEEKVTAKGTVNGTVFEDVNQTAKIGATNEPTLIADRVAAKVDTKGKSFPNGTVADSHAEIGVIQQAYNAGKTQGVEMSMTVSGKDVCGYSKGDIAAAANVAGLKSLTVQAVDDVTGLPKTYYWQPGMKSIKENP